MIAFDSTEWTLAMVVAWIMDRTRQAVERQDSNFRMDSGLPASTVMLMKAELEFTGQHHRIADLEQALAALGQRAAAGELVFTAYSDHGGTFGEIPALEWRMLSAGHDSDVEQLRRLSADVPPKVLGEAYRLPAARRADVLRLWPVAGGERRGIRRSPEAVTGRPTVARVRIAKAAAAAFPDGLPEDVPIKQRNFEIRRQGQQLGYVDAGRGKQAGWTDRTIRKALAQCQMKTQGTETEK